MTRSISEQIDRTVLFQDCHCQFSVSIKRPGLDIWKKSLLTTSTIFFDAKYRQIAFQSIQNNPYLETLVKQYWCKFRGLCLHSTMVVIFPNTTEIENCISVNNVRDNCSFFRVSNVSKIHFHFIQGNFNSCRNNSRKWYAFFDK